MTATALPDDIAPDEREPSRSVWAEFRRGLAAMAPILLGVTPFALVLGSQAAMKGLSPLEVALMCGLNFAGGSEFVAIELWRSPPQIALIAGMTLLVNCRHLLMGASFAPHLRRLRPWQAALVLFVMADETWALGMDDARRRMAATGRPGISLPYYAGLAVSLYIAWVAVTVLGAVVGPVLGNPHAYGFDMAFTAVFLVLIRGMWKGWRRALPWPVSLGVAALTHLAVPGAWYVPAGTLAGLAVAYFVAGTETPEAAP
ncbi:AzlC family protein [Nitrospirillum viridazoti Y2]|uniref:4-azaleucine resistance transporter AzlC n=1 Tax=Nitrospirillum amazonense TaxID=28077 RepID=A0A560I3L7_9PROT|nr:AzlC family ABC transporter permease [Nitrospirillum amazonense]EGY01913.1 AzlC family protein [Nitrospirillum amazonense Y2]TWB52771.1 4-azaleucine resistance transporter AzlC [Nitrospirillum amazonense]